ncbi:Craniofacial development protein 2 [Quillaja saponaria]|uniref:Craniofacial development protein 2 n=1 Tax=Quillaja saponaria TaxID=32244 RepID=A0AAD7VHR5_QUISA|nr:Craniofacial development protein 2 [Quillaja saponaria]
MMMNPTEYSLGRNPLSDALHRIPGVVRNEQGLGRHILSGAPHRRPGVVQNEQGFSHRGRMRVKKLVQGKIRIATWNIGTLTDEETFNIISAYAPQIGLEESTKKAFWEDLEEIVQGVPLGEKLFIGADLNGHVGSTNEGFERVRGGYGYGVKNEGGESILDFAVAYDLILANTQARKDAKKAVREARGKACEGLYQKLETKDGEKDIYRIAKQRERRTKDLIRIKCIKDEADRVLVKEDEINERWRTYFDTLFNEESKGDFGDLDVTFDDMNRRFVLRIRA